jgi:hypothetical protein
MKVVFQNILPYSDMIDIREEDRNYNYYHRIQEHEVKKVLKHMSNEKFHPQTRTCPKPNIEEH